jgi:hypothetical protein
MKEKEALVATANQVSTIVGCLCMIVQAPQHYDCEQHRPVALQVADPLEAFAPFKAYKRRGVEAAISCVTGAQAQRAVTDWAFTLCKANMQVRQHRGCVIRSLGMRACAQSIWPAVQWGACRSAAASAKPQYHDFGATNCRRSMRARVTWGGRTPRSVHS